MTDPLSWDDETEQLIQQVRAGQTDAFERLFARHQLGRKKGSGLFSWSPT